MTKFELHLDDCLEGMAKMPVASVDLIVTSPPYNLGIAYRKYSDRQKRSSYLDWLVRWGGEARRLLKPDGSLFLNLGASPSNPLLPHEIVLRLQEEWVLQNTIHWIKAISLPDDAAPGEWQSRGHFKPINSGRFLNDCHEYVFHLTSEGKTPLDRLALGVPYADKSNIARWAHTSGRDRRCRGNTWFVPYETIKDRERDRPHPATFPVELAVNCIKLHGNPEQLVMLDPFLGIGNSALAARQCGVRRFIGFELDPDYLAEAKRRLTELKATPELDLFGGREGAGGRGPRPTTRPA